MYPAWLNRVHPRPSDNDRYVPRAPENPKKVRVSPYPEQVYAHKVIQARFHYHGTCLGTIQNAANFAGTFIY